MSERNGYGYYSIKEAPIYFHPGNTVVSIQWESMGSGRLKCQLKREGLTKAVWEGFCTVCAHEVEHCLKFSPNCQPTRVVTNLPP